MKLVGVMGKSGAGKTTFTDFFAQNHNDVGIIHVDDLLSEVKKKYFRIFLQPKKRNTTESTKKNPKLNGKVKKLFYSNRFLFNLLMKVRSKLVAKPINQQIETMKSQGKEIIIIDDWVITTHEDLYPRLSKIYYVERQFSERREGLKERDDLTLEELKVADIPYARRYIDKPEDDRVITIKNRESIEDLNQKAKEEYEKVHVKTFDEKYVIDVEKTKEFSRLVKSRINPNKEDKKHSSEKVK